MDLVFRPVIDRVKALTKGDFTNILAVYCYKCGSFVTPENWKEHYNKCNFAEKTEVKNVPKR